MRRLPVVLITVLIVMGAGMNAYANVSSAAVLFLRIAAGARAAGMGEAFVAVADDATATHWNPAGLGTYPLSGKWFDIKIPEEYRPLKKMALFKNDGSDIDYRRFDIWAITDSGLVKFNKDNWSKNDIVEPGPEQTAESILRQYTGLAGDAADQKLPALLEILGKANNTSPRERIDTLRNDIISHLSEKYTGKEEIETALNALTDSYDKCLIDWNMVNQAGDICQNSLKDSVIDQNEADKLLVSLEKSKMRFLPERLIIPFDISLEGNIHDLAADDDFLWVVSDSGLYRYNGRNWQELTPDDKVPSHNFTKVRLFDKRAYLGSDLGLVVYDAGAFKYYGDSAGLPSGSIKGITVKDKDNVWILLDNDLYHFDGTSWKNYFEHSDVLGETDSSVYESMKIYGTPAEKTKYIEKFRALNPTAKAYQEDNKKIMAAIDTLGVYGGFLDAKFRKLGQTADTTAPKGTDAKSGAPGRVVRIPYTAGLDFTLTDIDLDSRASIWIGTEYGLLKYDGRRWSRFGYKNVTPEADVSLFDFASERVKGDSVRAFRLAENIKAVNFLQSDTLKAGQPVSVVVNPAGAKINEIQLIENRLYFATESGVIYYDGTWARVNDQDLGKKNSLGVEEKDNNVWFATSDRVQIRAGAKTEISMMHVNWLPEFANDMYYDFFSYVRSVEGWGTVGGNITFLSYGNITRTNEAAQVLGEFLPFDIAISLSYGTSLSPSLSGGLSAKVIYSHLSSLGTGQERGSGTSTGLALDAGLLYRLNRRLNFGMAITNVGPDISYIDVAQADPLPRNLAVGFAYKLLESQYNKALVTVEANKSLVAIGKGLSSELKEVILNGGAEYWYGSFIAFRAGYIYDQEGEVKTPTLGFGLAYKLFQFDFAYIPSSDNVPLANTMRFSLSIDL